MRIDRADSPTVQANDARDLTRSGRVALSRQAGGAYTVAVDDAVVGVIVNTTDGWVAARPGWRDTTPRSKRHAAVRRLIMSHPAASFGSPPTPGRDTP